MNSNTKQVKYGYGAIIFATTVLFLFVLSVSSAMPFTACAEKRSKSHSKNSEAIVFKGYRLSDTEMAFIKALAIEDFYKWTKAKELGFDPAKYSAQVGFWEELSKKMLITSQSKLTTSILSRSEDGSYKSFEGKSVLFSGKVDAVNRHEEADGDHVSFRSADQPIMLIRAFFNDGFRDYLAKLSTGQDIDIICRKINVRNDAVELHSCSPMIHLMDEHSKQFIFSFQTDKEKEFFIPYVLILSMAYPDFMSCMNMSMSEMSNCMSKFRMKPVDEKRRKQIAKTVSNKLRINTTKLKPLIDRLPKIPKYAEDTISIKTATIKPFINQVLYNDMKGAMLNLQYVNKGPIDITAVEVNVIIRDSFNEIVFKKRYEDHLIIESGSEVTNQGWFVKSSSILHQTYTKQDDILYRLAQTGAAKIKTEIVRVALKDGTILVSSRKSK
ncbi:MAG: hypothetical protein GX556_12495 [Fibrobacter sp.]|nr:hypothetical protein [Fibrobacter sp.]